MEQMKVEYSCLKPRTNLQTFLDSNTYFCLYIALNLIILYLLQIQLAKLKYHHIL